MKIEIQRIENFEYKVGNKAFPIIITILSDENREIAKKVDINSALLIKSDDDTVCFGFSQCITGMPGETLIIDHESPYKIEVDVFTDDEELDDFVSGSYQLKVNVSVFEKQESGEFRLVELSKESEFLIK